VLHGALLDAQLLAQVYVELMGGRQIGLGLLADTAEESGPVIVARAPAKVRPPRIFRPSETELAAHAAFLKDIKDPVWGAEASG